MNKVRIVAIARNEAAYLAEWINHHFHFGFDEITIVLNDCTDHSEALLHTIQKNEPRLYVRDGNALKRECEATHRNFQIAAYTAELQRIRESNDVTHLMCLDIDEFWISPQLSLTIHDFIERYPDAHSISFAWYMENPIDNAPFQSSIQRDYLAQKNAHVKSLHKITEKLIYLDIHNAIHENGKYVLANGREFPYNNRNGCARALIDESLINYEMIDPAFILHKVYRSKIEYLASLQRGLADEKGILKRNRWGYRSNSPSTPFLAIQHPADSVKEIHESYQTYLDTHSIRQIIESAHHFILAQAHITISLFKLPPQEIHDQVHLFSGITEFGIPSDLFHAKILFHIDKITLLDDQIEINGWTIDRNSNRPVCISIVDSKNTCITRRPRPDVVRHFLGTDENSGFSLRTPKPLNGVVSALLKCGNHTIEKQIKINN